MTGSDAATVLYDLLMQMGLSVPINLSAIGMSSEGGVGVGEDVVIGSGKLEYPFKPLRLYVPPTIGPMFEIMRIDIRDDSNDGEGDLVGSPIAVGPIRLDDGTHAWPMRRIDVGAEITFRVRNIGGAPAHCSYTLFGVEGNE